MVFRKSQIVMQVCTVDSLDHRITLLVGPVKAELSKGTAVFI